jgi:hypothetical protein
MALSLAMIVIPLWLVRTAIRRRDLGRLRLVLAGAGVASLVTAASVVRYPVPGSMWRGLDVLLLVIMAVSALPVVTWLGVAIRSLVQGDWWRLRWLIGGSLAASLILAGLILAVQAPRLSPELHYTSFGWWFILPIGAYAVGVLLLVWRGLQPLVEFVRTRLSGKRTHARPAV